LGGVLSFGEGDNSPAITVTMHDVRCSMVNLDPDSARPTPEMLKAVVRANRNNAGIYAAVTRIGRLEVGQTILLRPRTENKSWCGVSEETGASGESHLDRAGVKLTTLTKPQADYLGEPVEGPYQPDHSRY
jgi:hypothetical protein